MSLFLWVGFRRWCEFGWEMAGCGVVAGVGVRFGGAWCCVLVPVPAAGVVGLLAGGRAGCCAAVRGGVAGCAPLWPAAPWAGPGGRSGRGGRGQGTMAGSSSRSAGTRHRGFAPGRLLAARIEPGLVRRRPRTHVPHVIWITYRRDLRPATPPATSTRTAGTTRSTPSSAPARLVAVLPADLVALLVIAQARAARGAQLPAVLAAPRRVGHLLPTPTALTDVVDVALLLIRHGRNVADKIICSAGAAAAARSPVCLPCLLPCLPFGADARCAPPPCLPRCRSGRALFRAGRVCWVPGAAGAWWVWSGWPSGRPGGCRRSGRRDRVAGFYRRG